jgi:AraC-like DNA-binding protein
MKRNSCVFLWLVIFQHLAAQNHPSGYSDTLLNKSFDYLSARIAAADGNKAIVLAYAKARLEKAKREKNLKQAFESYKVLLHNESNTLHFFYADSMLAVASKTSDKNLIGSAYLTRGIVCYDHHLHTKALDNYMIAEMYLSGGDDVYLQYKTRYLIAQTKYYLGFYEEAISLFRKCAAYFKEENDRAYLSTLHSLGLCYNITGRYGDCAQINDLGLREGDRLKDLSMKPYFLHSEGVNQNSLHNYQKSIRLLQESLPAMAKLDDFSNENVACYYIGKSYWELGEKEKALPWLKKIDVAFAKCNYIRPDLRKGYELLITYYTAKNDQKSELYYVKKLMSLDSVFNQDYKYLSTKILKQYDTRQLIRKMNSIESDSDFQKIADTSVISLLGGTILFLIIRHKRKTQRYKRKFDELLLKSKSPGKVATVGSNDADLDINPDVVAGILKNLEKFENSRKYLDKDMTIVKIAAVLQTNTKYATRVISHHREKKTIEYINDLKVDYIVSMLYENPKFRNYTNKALGEEAGFGSTQNFTRAFNKVTGMSPTFFIAELKKRAV